MCSSEGTLCYSTGFKYWNKRHWREGASLLHLWIYSETKWGKKFLIKRFRVFHQIISNKDSIQKLPPSTNYRWSAAQWLGNTAVVALKLIFVYSYLKTAFCCWKVWNKLRHLRAAMRCTLALSPRESSRPLGAIGKLLSGGCDCGAVLSLREIHTFSTPLRNLSVPV